MRVILANCLGCVLVIAGLTVPIALGIHAQTRLRNFHAVREGVLYRCSQPTPKTLERLIRDHGIRTVVTLREDTSRADQLEKAFCDARGVQFIRIPPMSWDGVQGTAPVEKGLKRFFEVVSDPTNHPILLHCCRGVHRTGLYTAAYRVEFERWSVRDALEEMQELGYHELREHRDVTGFWASYRCTNRYGLRTADSRSLSLQSSR